MIKENKRKFSVPAHVERRTFIRGAAALLAAAGLAACKTTTTGNVTTITLNVAEVDTDGTAGLDVLKTVLAFTGVPATVLMVVDTSISGIETALAAWDKYCNGSATITYDASSVPTAATSVITALQNGASAISNVVSTESATLGTSLTSKITAVADDVASVGAIISGAVKALSSVSIGAETAGATPVALRTQRVNAILLRHGLPAVSIPA
ncbi:MAG: hypothetical protein ABF876_05330 [Acetobacter aceti]